MATGYELTAEIGRGAFATVYEAVQQSVGRTVALKVLAAFALGADLERRFRVECQSIGDLSWHPHVVSLYDAGFCVDGRPYLAMELLEEGSLADLVRFDGPLDPDVVLRAGIDIADALVAAHEAGVIHRDIKPDNILIGRNDSVLLSDFGVASLSDATQSTTGSFSGTYAYGAPEVHQGERAGVGADIFSLGASLYTLASGREAFRLSPDDSSSAVILRVVTEQAPPLPDHLPDGLVAVIDQCMAKKPSDRYLSALELRGALEAARVGGRLEDGRQGHSFTDRISGADGAADRFTGEFQPPSPLASLPLPAAQVPSEALSDEPSALADSEQSAQLEAGGEANPELANQLGWSPQRPLPTPSQIDGSANLFQPRRRWPHLTRGIPVDASIFIDRNTTSVAETLGRATFSGGGYLDQTDVVSTWPTSLRITRRYVPWWVMGITIVGFFACFLGLIALLYRASEYLTIDVHPEGQGSRVVVSGTASHRVLAILDAALSKHDDYVRPPQFLARPRRRIPRTALVLASLLLIVASVAVYSRALPDNGPIVWETVQVRSSPHDVAASRNAVWVAGSTTLDRIDPSSNDVDTAIQQGSFGAVAVTTSAVWALKDEEVRRVDPSTGSAVASLRLGWYLSDVAIGAGSVWVTGSGRDGDSFRGHVYRIDPASNAVIETIDGVGSFGHLAVTDDAVWVSDFDALYRIDPATNDVVASISLGGLEITGIAADNEGVWLSRAPFGQGRRASGRVTRIDPSTNKIVTSIEIGDRASAIAISDDGVWVTVSNTRRVKRVDPSTNKVDLTLDVDRYPIAVASGDGVVWVVNRGSSTVSRIE